MRQTVLGLIHRPNPVETLSAKSEVDSRLSGSLVWQTASQAIALTIARSRGGKGGLAPAALAAALASQLGPHAVVLAVGGPGVREALRQSGLDVLTPADVRLGDHPAIEGVLQGYGSEVTAADLAEAAYAVADGATWVATNTDATLPTHRGTAPGNGTLVAAVARATGVEPAVVRRPPRGPSPCRCSW